MACQGSEEDDGVVDSDCAVSTELAHQPRVEHLAHAVQVAVWPFLEEQVKNSLLRFRMSQLESIYMSPSCVKIELFRPNYYIC